MTNDFSVSTRARGELVDITDQVRDAVADSGVRDGLCCVFVPHTTAGVLINENVDPDVRRDVLAHLERVVPNEEPFRHSEGNSDAHIKAILVGSSKTIPIRKGRLSLGTWQGIFFAEFDGPRNRSFSVTCVGEA